MVGPHPHAGAWEFSRVLAMKPFVAWTNSDAARIHHVLRRRGSGARHFPADTHLIDWLTVKGFAFDVITDHDLDREGAALLRPYRAVVTGSHPEYHTRNTLDALQNYIDGGGRLAYLGGNGFYWRIATSPAIPDVLEIRRAEGGIRAWAAEPCEYFHALDGGYGGLWRRNGRPPQMLCLHQGVFLQS